MSIIVNIKPEVQEELGRQAAAQGIDIGDYAATLLEEAAHLAAGPKNEDIWQFPEADSSARMSEPALTTEKLFHKLADEWSSEVGNISSVTVLTSHPKYQKIISLGWNVVPYLLADLQNKRGYWFPALNAITGIRPFDPRDAGNIIRMTEAWIKWGKNKQLI